MESSFCIKIAFGLSYAPQFRHSGMTRNYIEAYRFSLRPTRICLTNVWSGSRFRMPISEAISRENLRHNQHNGKLSDNAKKKIATAIDWLLASAEEKEVFQQSTKKRFKFKINFVTLTVPFSSGTTVPTKELKSELNNLLTTLRKYYELGNYVWKLEFHKSGQPHIHLTTDSFLHHATLRWLWNEQLRRRGWLENYYSEHNHYNANSTDVHSVYKIKNVAAYLTKYMCKDNELEIPEVGRIWGCSQALSKAIKAKVLLTPDVVQESGHCLFEQPVEHFEIKSLPDELNRVTKWCDVFRFKITWWLSNASAFFKEAWLSEIEKLRHARVLRLNFSYVV